MDEQGWYVIVMDGDDPDLPLVKALGPYTEPKARRVEESAWGRFDDRCITEIEYLRKRPTD